MGHIDRSLTQKATRLLWVLSSMQHVAEDLMTALSSNTYSIQYPWHILVTLVKYWCAFHLTKIFSFNQLKCKWYMWIKQKFFWNKWPTFGGSPLFPFQPKILAKWKVLLVKQVTSSTHSMYMSFAFTGPGCKCCSNQQ